MHFYAFIHFIHFFPAELNNLPSNLQILFCGSNKLSHLVNLPLTIKKLYCENNKIKLNELNKLYPNIKEIHCCKDNNSIKLNEILYILDFKWQDMYKLYS